MKVLKFIAAIAISFLAAGIGSLATTPNIPTWYAGLEKPFFSPPNWLFAPVWTVLYIGIGSSLWLVWIKKAATSKTREYRLFAIQLALNALWSLIFFGMHQPWLAVVVIIALDIAVIATIWSFNRISRPAAGLLLPYLLWICFATCLNIGVAILN